MSTVKKGGLGEAASASDRPVVGPSKIGSELLKVKNSFEQDRAAKGPRPGYMFPHRTKTKEEIRIATARHHRAEMEEEQRRHTHQLLLEQLPGASALAEDREEYDAELDHLGSEDERRERKRRTAELLDEDEAEDEENDPEDAEEIVAAAQAAKEKGLAALDTVEKFYRDLPTDRLGDPTLTNPDEIRRALGPSVRFAQHAMVLAEEKLKANGSRQEALEFLAQLYVQMTDRAYANKALREYGPGTGILDLYPLEVIDHLLEHMPSFFTKLSRGRFLTSSPDGTYRGQTGKPIVLTYAPELRIRGFALAGGPRPGYLFEPVDPPGTYHLIFRTPGSFRALVSAMSKSGVISVEEITIEVEPTQGELEEPRTLKRERAHQAEIERRSAAEERKKKSDLSLKLPKRV